MKKLIGGGIVVCTLIVVGGVMSGFVMSAETEKPVTLNMQNRWSSQQECEKDSRKKCVFFKCDYIALGKTYEEACGNISVSDRWIPVPEKETDDVPR